MVRQWTLTPLCVGSSPTIPGEKKMSIEIYFNNQWKETTLPLIHLTKSRNGKTGTATFVFLRPVLFQFSFSSFFPLKTISVTWKKKFFETNDLQILFSEGKPFLVKTTFLFKNSQQWFEFVTLLNTFSKETGLVFSTSFPIEKKEEKEKKSKKK